MEMTKTVENGKAMFALSGKLTVQSAPKLEAEMSKLPDDVSDIEIDLSGVDYVASAGLRVFVTADKRALARGGRLRLLNPSDSVMDVLDVTGLSGAFLIER